MRPSATAARLARSSTYGLPAPRTVEHPYPRTTGITHHCHGCGRAWLCEAARHDRECSLDASVACNDCRGGVA